MRIVFIGSKDRGVRCLEALLSAGFDIVAVVTEQDTDPDAFWEGSVERTARDEELEVHVPDDINDPEFVDRLDELDPDLMTMSGFSQILGSEVLNVPDEGTVNLHAGKLPDYRGGSPMNWAIINGEEEATASIHFVTEEIDAGDVIAEKTLDIDTDDTIADLRQKTLEAFPRMLVDVVKRIRDGRVDPRENDPSEGTYWGSRLPQDGRIDFERMTAKEVYDFVRALTHPYPGAFITYEGTRLYVWEAETIDGTVKHMPGRICMKRGNGRVVAASDEGVLLKSVQLDGEKEKPATEVLSKGDYL